MLGLYSPDAADALGIAEQTARKWRSRKCGPRYLKVGRRVVYQWEDIEDFLALRSTADSDCPKSALNVA